MQSLRYRILTCPQRALLEHRTLPTDRGGASFKASRDGRRKEAVASEISILKELHRKNEPTAYLSCYFW